MMCMIWGHFGARWRIVGMCLPLLSNTTEPFPVRHSHVESAIKAHGDVAWRRLPRHGDTCSLLQGFAQVSESGLGSEMTRILTDNVAAPVGGTRPEPSPVGHRPPAFRAIGRGLGTGRPPATGTPALGSW